MTSQRPASRKGFRIGIVCALRHESSAVRAMFDETWDASQYGKAPGDPNSYTPGRIGWHNTVLAYLPSIGATTTATLTAHLIQSFPSVDIVLVVGICGGAPFDEEGKPIRLGDVIISDYVFEYALARTFPDGRRTKNTLDDSLPQPNQAIRGFLHKVQTEAERKALQERMMQSLKLVLEDEDYASFRRPNEETNRLFHAKYRHKHQKKGKCNTCDNWKGDRDPVCEFALTASCSKLECDHSNSTTLSGTPIPTVHFGTIASANEVLKSAIDRDILVEKAGVIAFEMEGAGAWENIPTIIVKSVCDFADSHKNKDWQNYASAVAACCMKALIAAWTSSDLADDESPRAIAHKDQQKRNPPGDDNRQSSKPREREFSPEERPSNLPKESSQNLGLYPSAPDCHATTPDDVATQCDPGPTASELYFFSPFDDAVPINIRAKRRKGAMERSLGHQSAPESHKDGSMSEAGPDFPAPVTEPLRPQLSNAYTTEDERHTGHGHSQGLLETRTSHESSEAVDKRRTNCNTTMSKIGSTLPPPSVYLDPSFPPSELSQKQLRQLLRRFGVQIPLNAQAPKLHELFKLYVRHDPDTHDTKFDFVACPPAVYLSKGFYRLLPESGLRQVLRRHKVAYMHNETVEELQERFRLNVLPQANDILQHERTMKTLEKEFAADAI